MVLRVNFYTGPSKFYQGQARVGPGVATPLEYSIFIESVDSIFIESVDSISRDEPDSPLTQYIIYKRWNISR